MVVLVIAPPTVSLPKVTSEAVDADVPSWNMAFCRFPLTASDLTDGAVSAPAMSPDVLMPGSGALKLPDQSSANEAAVILPILPLPTFHAPPPTPPPTLAPPKLPR